jgi:cobalt/nickel transport protein
MNKLQKKILLALLGMAFLTPVGIFLPMFFNAGDAWGEWSAETMKDLVGYVPEGLARYTGTWKAPLDGYSLNIQGGSAVHQSGFYLVSGILGAMLSLLVTMLVSKLIVRDGK